MVASTTPHRRPKRVPELDSTDARPMRTGAIVSSTTSASNDQNLLPARSSALLGLLTTGGRAVIAFGIGVLFSRKLGTSGRGLMAFALNLIGIAGVFVM